MTGKHTLMLIKPNAVKNGYAHEIFLMVHTVLIFSHRKNCNFQREKLRRSIVFTQANLSSKV